jgi:hypothetical protein
MEKEKKVDPAKAAFFFFATRGLSSTHQQKTVPVL